MSIYRYITPMTEFPDPPSYMDSMFGTRLSFCSCAQTGETLQDLLSTDFPRLENAVNVACVPVNVNLTQLAEQFESLLTYFYQRYVNV